MNCPEPSLDVEVSMLVNDLTITRRVSARQHLADFLREDLCLTGTHLGCEHGVCGACAVLVDGKVVRGCLMLAAQADGAIVDTIEGVSDSGEIEDLQDEFLNRNAAQCGFCTSGMLLAAYEFLGEKRQASRVEIREAISGNLCRCTGYQAIVDAVEATMKRRAPP
jgi:carbon-monoxide dehydrogenase small subunit